MPLLDKEVDVKLPQPPSTIERDTSKDLIKDELLIAKLQEQFENAKINLHEEFCYAHDCKELPEKMESTPKMKKLRKMDMWCKTLDLRLQKAVDEVTGTSKRNPNIRLEGEIVFCHILPYVMRCSKLMSMRDLLKLEKATSLVVICYNLIKRYAGIPMKEVERIQGMGLYKDFHKEKDFNKTCIRLSLAALMRHGFNVEKLV